MPYSRSLLFIYFIYSSWYWPYPFEVTFQFLFNMVGFWTYSSHPIPDKDRYSILGNSCVPWICNKERNTWGHCTYLSGSSRRQCEGTKPRAALRKSVYLFSLTPRLYCQLFWQEMCRNLPPSVILCETSNSDIEMGIRIGYWNGYQLYINSDMSVWGHVRFRRLRAQPHKTPPHPPFKCWSQAQAVSVFLLPSSSSSSFSCDMSGCQVEEAGLTDLCL